MTSAVLLKEHVDNWDLKALKDGIFTRFGVDIYAEGIKPETLNRGELGDAIFDKLKERYNAKEQMIGPEAMRYHERMIMLSVLDSLWKDHLLNMDHLKEGIGLRGYGQHDPLVEYKRESFDMFEEMMKKFQEETVRYLYLMQVLERPPEGGVGPDGGPGGPLGQGGPEAGVPALRPGGGGMEGLRGTLRRRSMTWKKLSSGRSAANSSQARMAGGGEQKTVQQVVRGATRLGATIHVLADQARNTRSATDRSRRSPLPETAPNALLVTVTYFRHVSRSDVKLKTGSAGGIS